MPLSSSNATDHMLRLRSKYERNLREVRAPNSAVILAAKLFSSPVMTIPAAADHLKMTYASAKSAVTHLTDAGILERNDTRKRGKIYVAREILDAFS